MITATKYAPAVASETAASPPPAGRRYLSMWESLDAPVAFTVRFPSRARAWQGPGRLPFVHDDPEQLRIVLQVPESQRPAEGRQVRPGVPAEFGPVVEQRVDVGM